MSYDMNENNTKSCSECKQPYTPTWSSSNGICPNCVRKDKEVYEWQWYIVNIDKTIYITNSHYTEENKPYDDWTKFEPSKRLRK